MNDTLQDLPILPFPDRTAFEAWLAKHHETVPGIWVKFYKKAAALPTIAYTEAVEVALCYGWIDSQMKSLDDTSYIQKFTPRKGKSPWSALNKERVTKLIQAGRMQPAGLVAIEKAKANGQWDSAYATPTNMIPPPEFIKALKANKKAHEFFEMLNKTQRFYFLYRITSAKREETKTKRIKEAIEKLERGEKMNP